MTRVLRIFVTVWLLLTTGTASCTVLCLEPDGHSAIEFAGSACCLHAEPLAASRPVQVAAPEHGCLDYSLLAATATSDHLAKDVAFPVAQVGGFHNPSSFGSLFLASLIRRTHWQCVSAAASNLRC